MRSFTPLTLVLLMFAAPVDAQERPWMGPRDRVQFSPVYSWHHVPPEERDYRQGPAPYIGGTWYMWGDPDQPTYIYQRPGSHHAVFVNEHGSRAEGEIWGNHVWIPSWGENGQGQAGTIEGDRIVWWPSGSYWSR
jgi:hypothetical protein